MTEENVLFNYQTILNTTLNTSLPYLKVWHSNLKDRRSENNT
jgi:hypothetical protein